MSVRDAPDRRGRAVRGSSGLLQRETTLKAIDALIAGARGGQGSALLLEGYPGMGKTRLHEAALDRARGQGLRVVRGAGAELERNLSFGVASQLLAALLADFSPVERRELLDAGPAALRILSGAAKSVSSPTYGLAVAQALFGMIAEIAEGQPVLVAVDDLHWCDLGSLEFVLYLLHRLEALPVAVVMTSRPTVPDDARGAFDRISSHVNVRAETLASLDEDAVAKLARASLKARATPALAEACHASTSGNPFYLRELLLALNEEPGLGEERLAQRALELVPDAVGRVLRVRVGRLGDEASSLARSVAILGDDVPLRHAAALAGLSTDSAARAAAGLASVEILLAREPLRFVHPLVRHAVQRDIPAWQLAGCHLDAARLLYAGGEQPERVAAHLLLGRPEGDSWVVEQLLAAAARANERGATRSAITYLERALLEPPDRRLRVDVLAELGALEARLGLPDAESHLVAAAAAAEGPVRRAELARERGRALYRQGSFVNAAEAFEAGIRELAESTSSGAAGEIRDELQSGYVTSASMVPELRGESARRSAELLQRPMAERLSHGRRLVLAQAAQRAALAGEPSAYVRELADGAWDGGRLLREETAAGLGWVAVVIALNASGQFERSIDVLDTVIADARGRTAPLSLATATYCRALPLFGRGELGAAAADVEHALESERLGWRQFARGAAAIYALCLIELGRLEAAEKALGALHTGQERALDLEDAVLLSARAELRLAQGRPEEALEDALATRRVLGEENVRTAVTPWQASAAAAWLALGDRSRGLALAQELLAHAEHVDIAHERVRALRLIGLCEEGEQKIHRLTQAVALGRHAEPRLETIRALVELGAALRRANRRSEARKPLQQAADLARAGGAVVLHDRARTELAASGARPRRDAFLTGPGSLTPSERRIAELAASGQTNREIAAGLFVTPKTVEYHLRNAYRKLEIGTRRDLADALK